MAAGKVTGTNREVEAVVAASFAARTAASSFSRITTGHSGSVCGGLFEIVEPHSVIALGCLRPRAADSL